jgi:hypothetical protein
MDNLQRRRMNQATSRKATAALSARGRLPMLIACLLVVAATAGGAETDAPAEPAPNPNPSPWMALPLVSSSPKLGTSVGALGAYNHYFDAESRPSLFGVGAQYTSSKSTIGGAFGKASFDHDTQRVLLFLGGGRINNEYKDFLGSGYPVATADRLKAFGGRYLYRVSGDWFVGAQGVYTNYEIVGATPLDQQLLDLLGLTGFKGGGAGLVAMHDSRDNDNMPSRGWVANLNNVAYREAWDAPQNFDVARLDLRGYWSQGNGSVVAARLFGQFTQDAPAAAYAPIQLRGYKVGQYLGKYMTSIEGEYRWRFARRWTATAFTGVACLYGGGRDCGSQEDLYPAIGAGVQYLVRPKEGIVANLEYAKGKGSDYGVYLKMGYAY